MFFGHRTEVEMGPGMTGDLVTTSVHALDQGSRGLGVDLSHAVGFGILIASEKESHVGIVSVQEIEEGAGMLVGTIVEGQSDGPRDSTGATR